jgi:hypothetical protein
MARVSQPIAREPVHRMVYRQMSNVYQKSKGDAGIPLD